MGHLRNGFVVCTLALTIGCHVPNCRAADAAPAALTNKLKSLAGSNSDDCGTVALHDDPGVAVACAQRADAAGKTYRIAVEFKGPDSIAWQGAVRDQQGKLWAVYYESDVSDSPGATLSVVHCRQILFASSGDDIIDCKPIIGEP
jgi:hypothetical protein